MPEFTKHCRGEAIRKFYLIALACLQCFLVAPAQADERANKIEAAFLYNFFNYITWPGYESPEAMKEATICFTDVDPLLPYLNYIGRKRADERTLTLKQVNEDTMDGCQLLFTRSNNTDFLRKLHAAAEKRGILLVANTANDASGNAMISLAQEGERISIEIDNSTLKSTNFQVSSRLLGLARKVK